MKIYLNAPRIICTCGARVEKSSLVKFIFGKKEHTGCGTCLKTCDFCDNVIYSRWLRRTLNGSKDCTECGRSACKGHHRKCSSCKKHYCLGCDIIEINTDVLTYIDITGIKLFCRRCYRDILYLNNELKNKDLQKKIDKVSEGMIETPLVPYANNPENGWTTDTVTTSGTSPTASD